MDMNLVGCLADFLYHRRRVFRRSGRSSGVCHLHSTGFFVHGAPFSERVCAARKKSVVLTVYNVFCCLSGSTGIFLPEILPIKENRRTPFQNTVIDTGLSQIRRVFQLGLFQVCCDNHGSTAAIAAVDDEKHLLHSIFGTALYSQIVNDKQVIFVKAGNKLRPVLREHPGQVAQDGRKVRHQHRHILVK